MVLAAAETPGPIGTPDVEGCNLYAAAIERVEFWAAVVGQRGGTLSVDNRLDDVAVRVTMSESDLSQILDVLIDNASRHGGTHPTIVVTVGDGPKGTVDITVTDDGPGVATEDRSKLTSRFYSSGTGSGSGLGLSIVDVVVRAAGGLLEFGDSPAGGLLVRVRLAALGQSIELEEK